MVGSHEEGARFYLTSTPEVISTTPIYPTTIIIILDYFSIMDFILQYIPLSILYYR